MMPRVVQRKNKIVSKPLPLPTSSTAGPTSSPRVTESGNDSMVLDGAAKALESLKLNAEDQAEQQRLEALLLALETCLSDWSLSVHKSTGLLQKLRESTDGCTFLLLA